jgi:hypothetical protein
MLILLELQELRAKISALETRRADDSQRVRELESRLADSCRSRNLRFSPPQTPSKIKLVTNRPYRHAPRTCRLPTACPISLNLRY